MRHVIRAVVGFIVLYIISAIIMMDPGGAMTLILLSIICTLGISLAIWIPLSYLVGWIILGSIQFILRLTEAAERQPESPKSKLQTLSKQLDQTLQPESSLTNDQRAMANYITKARGKGLTNEEISSKLRNNGWSVDAIKWGFDFVKVGGG